MNKLVLAKAIQAQYKSAYDDSVRLFGHLPYGYAHENNKGKLVKVNSTSLFTTSYVNGSERTYVISENGINNLSVKWLNEFLTAITKWTSELLADNRKWERENGK